MELDVPDPVYDIVIYGEGGMLPSPVNKLTEGNTQRGYLAFLVGTHFIIHVYTMLLPVLLLPLQEELGIS